MKSYLINLLVLLVWIGGCSDNPTKSELVEDTVMIPKELKCSDGLSKDTYSCENVDMVAHVSVEKLLTQPSSNGKALNDIWGWTDPISGIEYAVVGMLDGIVFVDISTPSEPKVIAKLEESATESKSNYKSAWTNTIAREEKSTWRDFKVYQNYLYIVSDGQAHGMQVFDLTKLRKIKDPPAFFSENVLYEEFENAHNIAINPETGFAYVGGSNTFGGGLHIIDISNPLAPEFAGFHSDSTVGWDSTGYVHDMQCVNYIGPDVDYRGDEICMNSSETHLVIAGVTDKENTKTISKATYKGNKYAHQGWLTEDHRYFLLDDELDEQDGGNTRTYIWDVEDLDHPQMIGTHESVLGSIDHNQYVKGNYVYQANYTSGLRILSLENIAEGSLEEVAYFDTYPEGNRAEFNGAWSNYPFFKSGIVIVSDINNGLFILKPNLE